MNLLKKEPILLGAALIATVHGVCLLSGLDEATTAGVDTIVLAWVAWLQRVLSVPVVKADAATAELKNDAAIAKAEAHDAGRNAALADVASLAPVEPLKAKRPAKKAAPAKR